MSRQFDAKQEALKAHPHDQMAGVDLFLGYLDATEGDFRYEEGMSPAEYIYGKQSKAKCPSCNEADLDHRQEERPHLCGWCGYNHETGEVAGFKSASDPFAHL